MVQSDNCLLYLSTRSSNASQSFGRTKPATAGVWRQAFITFAVSAKLKLVGTVTNWSWDVNPADGGAAGLMFWVESKSTALLWSMPITLPLSGRKTGEPLAPPCI